MRRPAWRTRTQSSAANTKDAGKYAKPRVAARNASFGQGCYGTSRSRVCTNTVCLCVHGKSGWKCIILRSQGLAGQGRPAACRSVPPLPSALQTRHARNTPAPPEASPAASHGPRKHRPPLAAPAAAASRWPPPSPPRSSAEVLGAVSPAPRGSPGRRGPREALRRGPATRGFGLCHLGRVGLFPSPRTGRLLRVS